MRFGFTFGKKAVFIFSAFLFVLFFAFVVNGEEACDIKTFLAKDVAVGGAVELSYSCTANNIDAKLNIFDSKKGVPLLSLSTDLVCSKDVRIHIINNPALIEVPGVYVARLTTDACSKDAFFSVREKSKAAVVPDSNLFIVFLLVAVVVGLLYQRKRK